MKNAAAFQACFTDWKLIKGRKVVQVVLELPIEQANQAYQALGGMPNPAESAWVAVARLNPEREAATNRTARSTASPPAPEEPEPPPVRAPLAERVRKMCGVKLFQQYLHQNNMIDLTAIEPTPFIQAKTAVKLICSVEHTAEIEPDTYAAEKWNELYTRFLIWRDAPDLVA